MNDNADEKLLSEEQQKSIDILYSGTLPMPRFNNLPPGFDMENAVAEARICIYTAIVKKGLKVKYLKAYWRASLYSKVCNELNKHYPVRFVFLDDDAITHDKLEKLMIDKAALEKIQDQVSMKLLFAKFIDNMKTLSDVQKALVKYEVRGIPEKEIAAKMHLSLSRLNIEMKLAKTAFKKELRKCLKQRELRERDRKD